MAVPSLHCGLWGLVPWQGLTLGPVHWGHRVLVTGPSGRPLIYHVWFLFFVMGSIKNVMKNMELFHRKMHIDRLTCTCMHILQTISMGYSKPLGLQSLKGLFDTWSFKNLPVFLLCRWKPPSQELTIKKSTSLHIHSRQWRHTGPALAPRWILNTMKS